MGLLGANYFPFTYWKDRLSSLLYSKPASKKNPVEQKVSAVMQRALDEEQKIADAAVKDKWTRFPVSVIGGDVLNIGLLALQGVAAFTASAALNSIVMGFGIVAGLFNLGEGLLSFKEAIHALHSNDKPLAIRLMLQGALKCLLGAGLLVISIATFAGAGAITAFFAANPYIIPAIIAGLALIWLVEIMNHLGPVMMKTDLGSQLDLPKLEKILENPNKDEAMKEAKNWVRSNVKECFETTEDIEAAFSDEKKVKDKLDRFKSEIGFPAAMEAFRLFEMILKEKKVEEIQSQIKTVKSKVDTWNRMLYLKLFSVLLTTVGFCLGMASFGTKIGAMDGIQNLAMSAGTAVPLYLDSQRPFEREIPIVVHRELKKPAAAVA